MQREPLGDVWETWTSPTAPQLVSDFNEAERVHPPHRLWHYSNLVYSMLGEVVARLDGRDVGRVAAGADPRPAGDAADHGRVRRPARGRLLRPALLRRPVARSRAHDLRALDPCGGLASTGADLASWSSFVADPVAEVLSPDTVEEMCQPQILIDREGWTAAMGLGFFLIRSGKRTYVGHTGGMPGHITALFTDRKAETGGMALTNSGATPGHRRFRDRAGRPRHRARAGRARAVAARHRASLRSSPT